MKTTYAMGLDFGTNSMRVLIVDVRDGRELSSAVGNYPRGDSGIILDREQPDLARQDPTDYLATITSAVKQAIEWASNDGEFTPRHIIGIGVDTTGSTPMPVDRKGQSLAIAGPFAGNPDAMAWLWKDHTGHAEANELTSAAENCDLPTLKKSVEDIPPNGSGPRFSAVRALRPPWLPLPTPGLKSPIGFPPC